LIVRCRRILALALAAIGDMFKITGTVKVRYVQRRGLQQQGSLQFNGSSRIDVKINITQTGPTGIRIDSFSIFCSTSAQ
jgi:hypothetical protein